MMTRILDALDLSLLVLFIAVKIAVLGSFAFYLVTGRAPVFFG